MSSLALSDSFEYLCYGSTTISNSSTVTVRGSLLVIRIWRLKAIPALWTLLFAAPSRPKSEIYRVVCEIFNKVEWKKLQNYNLKSKT